MGGVLDTEPYAERLGAAEVGEQGAVALVRIVAERCTEAAAQQGKAAEKLLAVEGVQLRVAVVDHAHFITQGPVERALESQVGVDFQVAGGRQAHARGPLTHIPATVMTQVQTTME
ncbi:hypothetical protein D3C76_1163760 [compost metagenome]